MQAPGSGPRLQLAGPLPACGLRGPVRGLSMFQAPGLRAGGAWQQAGGVGLARRLPLGGSTEASVPAKSTAQQSPFLHSLCNTQLGQGSCSVLGHGDRRDPASSSAEVAVPVAVPVAEPPSRTGLSCACPRGLQQQNPQPGGSKRRKCHASRVCRLGVRGRAAAGPCARWAPFLPLPALAVAGRPGGPWTVPAHLPGTPGVSARGPPCSDVTSPYPITSAVSRPRSQVLGVRASTCLLLRGTEFNP